jgi:hypothetical protein
MEMKIDFSNAKDIQSALALNWPFGYEILSLEGLKLALLTCREDMIIEIFHSSAAKQALKPLCDLLEEIQQKKENIYVIWGAV